MGGNASKETIQKSEETNKGPWQGAVPYYNTLYANAQNAFDKTTNNPFMGDYTAGATPDAGVATSMLRNNALGGQIGAGANDFLSMATRTAQGGYMDPSTNPFIGSVARASLQPVTEQLTNKVLPGIKDAAIAGGAYGGARQDLQENDAVQSWGRTAGDLTSNIFMQNYMQERQNQLGSGNLLGQGYGLANAPAEQMLQLDTVQRGLNQLGLTNELQKYQGNQAAPWYGLGELGQLLAQGGFSSGTSHTTMDNPNYVDPLTQALKIAIGGAGAVASMGGAGGFNMWGK